MPGDAAVFKHQALVSGVGFQVFWKSWVSPGAEGVRWSLKLIFATAGYKVSKSYRLHDHVRDQRKQFEPVFASLGLESSWGQSRNSVMQSKRPLAPASDESEQEWWAETEAMLALLLLWMERRRFPMSELASGRR